MLFVAILCLQQMDFTRAPWFIAIESPIVLGSYSAQLEYLPAPVQQSCHQEIKKYITP